MVDIHMVQFTCRDEEHALQLKTRSRLHLVEQDVRDMYGEYMRGGPDADMSVFYTLEPDLVYGDER
ncbi:hypothetical protein PHMEG_00023562 [Phytophthora megakarya]|uniref:Uncharacterized protein n=1 Tax=Phytophthora megakarya TaxID=4795 RepID=A0A225VHS5_9STRA|nr:hypothetical protein PHMEG_00023562 [Phytophthora megakarya]